MGNKVQGTFPISLLPSAKENPSWDGAVGFASGGVPGERGDRPPSSGSIAAGMQRAVAKAGSCAGNGGEGHGSCLPGLWEKLKVCEKEQSSVPAGTERFLQEQWWESAPWLPPWFLRATPVLWGHPGVGGSTSLHPKPCTPKDVICGVKTPNPPVHPPGRILAPSAGLGCSRLVPVPAPSFEPTAPRSSSSHVDRNPQTPSPQQAS